MLAIVRSATLLGVRGTPVTVEVHVSAGLPGFTIVGLPDASCREARDRVRAALLSTGLRWPEQRTTVNLAPSGVRKVGAGLDLAIAIGVLVATQQLPAAVLDRCYLGELGLDGTIRPVVGGVPLAGCLPSSELVVAPGNAVEASVVGRHQVRPVESLARVIACATGDAPWPPVPERVEQPPPPVPDLTDVRGNRFARLALEVAAAGGHHLLYVGPPGAGKTMLAERLPGILEPLGDDEAVEVTTVHSAAGESLPTDGLIRTPPFRSPHHTVSNVALVGGGSHQLRPGEVSLAHRGVLFLDEMGEFSAVGLDALRQPLESGCVRISRAYASATLPAAFQLVGSMNPCPCGFAGSAAGGCRCSSAALSRYARRLSGPLLDRFDVRVRVEPTEAARLVGEEPGESSAAVAARVAAARARARDRGVACNRLLAAADLQDAARLEPDARRLLRQAVEGGRLSGRGLRRVRTVALTIDDLAGGDGRLGAETVASALALRAELRFGEVS